MPARALAATLLLSCVSPMAMAQLGPYGNTLLTDAIPDLDAQFGETVVTGDFDGDGRPDFAAAARRFGAPGSDGRVTVFMNRNGQMQRGLYSGEFVGDAGSQLGWAMAACDIDGDGSDELAIGVPGDSNFGGDGAGAVRIYKLAPISGLGGFLWTQTQILAQGDLLGSVSVEGDRLGAALACADFNDDGFADLAIGAPQKEVGAVDNAGKVVVIYGRETGLSNLTDEIWTQDTLRNGFQVDDLAEADDRFGEVLAAGDFDRDGFFDLVVGVPSEDVGSTVDAGAVHVLFGTADGIGAERQFLFDTDYTADELNTGDFPEAGDRFGFSLAVGDFNRSDNFLQLGYTDLAIGAPFKPYAAIDDAGYVYVIYGGSGAALFDDADGTHHGDSPDAGQDNEHFGYSLAAGNFDGDRQRDLAVGRPGRSVATVDDAGMVTVFYGQPTVGLEGADTQTFTAQPGYASAPYGYLAGYGVALAAADFDGDGASDLAVGIRDQTVAEVEQAGAVQLIFTRVLFADQFEQ